ncbi:hypothetical protein [Chryseobacterium sp. JV558]|uniref:hypothetical protein n=1 Tax=Chryseobacterium sp. JV558 TaxID=2663236 RepID=UPI00299D438A|nr:hypothetical protein [Chryseobacterium sp. JV558]MDW9382815.1 hypothetical protein [Chryseobacterium sp. JV558]
MEENKLIPRNQLKTYFETGKHPTQNQFSDLIDSLRHKEDVQTKREMVIFLNQMAYIDNTFIYYYLNNVGDLEIQIVVTSSDEEDQIITMRDSTKVGTIRQFLLGSAPYTITIEKTKGGGDLKGTEYYSLGYQLSPSYYIRRLFGNNLPAIPDGYEFGDLQNNNIPIDIHKEDIQQKVSVVNTNIKFINKTEIPIQYRAYSQYWGDKYKTEDSVTDHYDVWDFLYLYYNADLREINQSIQCNVYDADLDTLLTTGVLNAGQSQETWWGGQVEKVRNIRIECNYVINEN